MTLPVPTTTVTVHRPAHDPTADAYDPDTGPAALVAEAVAAHFNRPAVSDGNLPPPATKEILRAQLLIDPVDLRQGDEVTDDTTGELWTVDWARAVNDLDDRPAEENDSHVAAQVVLVRGAG